MKYFKSFSNYIKESYDHNENFIKWFGNSKITENGKPLICYHGTPIADIKSFDFTRIGYNRGNYGHYGYGIYFSTDIREADGYGDHIYKCFLKVENPFTGTDEQIIELKNSGVDNIDDLVVKSVDFDSFKEGFKNDPIVYQFLQYVEHNGLEYAWDNIMTNFGEPNNRTKEMNDKMEKLNDISNTIEYTTLNKHVDGVPEYVFTDFEKWNIQPKLNHGFPYHQSLHWITDLGNRSKDVTDVIKQLGYDGVFYGSEIVVFEPNQIKSIDNDGSWDLDDNNIYS